MPLASIAHLNEPAESVAWYIDQAKKLSTMYDEFLVLEQDKEDDGRRAPGIHASELFPCMRMAVYSVGGVERRSRISKFWLQRFKMGTAIHEMIQSDFLRMAKRSQQGLAMRYALKMAEDNGWTLDFAEEVPVRPDLQPLAAHYNIHSSCDGVFTFYEPNGAVALRVGLEIKSEAPDGYEKLKGPKPDHIMQGHLYMASLDLPLMWFFYMNKGNQNNTNSSAPFLMVWDPTAWAELEQRILAVHGHAAAGTLPERTETIICEFCAWNYTCGPSQLTQIRTKAPSRKDSIRGPGG